MTDHKGLQNTVAHGWTLMFLIFTANLLMDLVRANVDGAVRPWADHMGSFGAQLVYGVMGIYAIMPLLIRSVSARWFRWAVVGVTTFIGLFVVAHEVSHLGSTVHKPLGILHVLDFAHHAVAIWVTGTAALWATRKLEGEPESSPQFVASDSHSSS